MPKPEVWSSSDSLDIDDVLAVPLSQSSDASLPKLPTLDDNVFKIKSNRGVAQRRNKNTEPNTVAVTRRNIPGNKPPLENRFSSPGANKRWVIILRPLR